MMKIHSVIKAEDSIILKAGYCHNGYLLFNYYPRVVVVGYNLREIIHTQEKLK